LNTFFFYERNTVEVNGELKMFGYQYPLKHLQWQTYPKQADNIDQSHNANVLNNKSVHVYGSICVGKRDIGASVLPSVDFVCIFVYVGSLVSSCIMCVCLCFFSLTVVCFLVLICIYIVFLIKKI